MREERTGRKGEGGEELEDDGEGEWRREGGRGREGDRGPSLSTRGSKKLRARSRRHTCVVLLKYGVCASQVVHGVEPE